MTTENQAERFIKNRRVFIVEDDNSCETVLTRIIRSIDPKTRIDWIEDAEQAVVQLERLAAWGESYDLIIADIFLSGNATGLDLWALCEHRYPGTPLLVTSSLPADHFLELVGKQAIVPPFLPKPFAVGECRQMLEGLLSYRKSA